MQIDHLAGGAEALGLKVMDGLVQGQEVHLVGVLVGPATQAGGRAGVLWQEDLVGLAEGIGHRPAVPVIAVCFFPDPEEPEPVGREKAPLGLYPAA